MTNRLNWIDSLKAICIICVYLMHCGIYGDTDINCLKCFISPFYVNGFFLVSGYLLFRKHLTMRRLSEYKSKNFRSSLSGILFRLLLPTILFSALLFIPKMLFHKEELDVLTFIGNILGGTSFWFTSALAVSQTALLSLMFLTKRKSLLFYLFCTTIPFILFSFIFQQTPSTNLTYSNFWYWQTGLSYTFIMTIGGVYALNEEKVNRLIGKKGVIVSIVLYCIIITVNPEDTLYMGITSRCSPDGLATMLVSFIWLVACTKIIPSNGCLNFIGKNSIVFYFLSGALPASISSLYSHYSFLGNNLISLTILTFFSLAIAFVLVKFIIRYLPFAIDLRKQESLSFIKNEQ